MTSKAQHFLERPLCSLAYKSENQSYAQNLSALLHLLDQAPSNAVLVVPELAITNFDYEHFFDAAAYATTITQAFCKVVNEQVVVVTMIEKHQDKVYNIAKVFHKGKVIHQQAKVELFKFGGEHDYFSAGNLDEIVSFKVDGIRFGLLICFEIRFKSLWKRLEGADVLLIPAQWGKLRTQNFVVLTNALAIVNQCYVVASDTRNKETTGMSGIITPFGEEQRNNENVRLNSVYKEKEVRKMRRYLDVGIA